MWLGIKMNEMIGIPAKAVDSKLVKNAVQPIFALHMDGRLEEAHDVCELFRAE